jgi:hypothetical protein
MRQFDVPKKRWDADLDEATHGLLNLAGDIEAEELDTQADAAEQDELETGPSCDNDEGWIDEREDMLQEELDELEESVQPMRVLLTKVSKRVSKSCIVLANQSTRLRYENLHTQSRTQLPSPFLSGTRFSRLSRLSHG